MPSICHANAAQWLRSALSALQFMHFSAHANSVIGPPMSSSVVYCASPFPLIVPTSKSPNSYRAPSGQGVIVPVDVDVDVLVVAVVDVAVVVVDVVVVVVVMVVVVVDVVVTGTQKDSATVSLIMLASLKSEKLLTRSTFSSLDASCWRAPNSTWSVIPMVYSMLPVCFNWFAAALASATESGLPSVISTTTGSSPRKPLYWRFDSFCMASTICRPEAVFEPPFGTAFSSSASCVRMPSTVLSAPYVILMLAVSLNVTSATLRAELHQQSRCGDGVKAPGCRATHGNWGEASAGTIRSRQTKLHTPRFVACQRQ